MSNVKCFLGSLYFGIADSIVEEIINAIINEIS